MFLFLFRMIRLSRFLGWRGLDKEFCREAIEGGTGNGNNLDAEFAKGAKFRRGRTGNGNNERNVRDVFAMFAMEERAAAKAVRAGYLVMGSRISSRRSWVLGTRSSWGYFSPSW